MAGSQTRQKTYFNIAMGTLSVVIITLNEENNIVDCIQSAKKISDDIIIVDSGSKDQTVALAKNQGARSFAIEWSGFGYARNFGAWQAKNDWILALDADERISDELAASIKKISFSEATRIYKFRRRNYLNGKKILFGTLGFENVKRIYNRQHCKWDLTPVHEKLIGDNLTLKEIKGQVLHYGLKDLADYKAKAKLYARLSAEKYFLQGRKTYLLKKYFSAIFNSSKSYFLQLGLLEGTQGLMIAAMVAYYSWLKYFYLLQLVRQAKKKDLSFELRSKMKAAS